MGGSTPGLGGGRSGAKWRDRGTGAITGGTRLAGNGDGWSPEEGGACALPLQGRKPTGEKYTSRAGREWGGRRDEAGKGRGTREATKRRVVLTHHNFTERHPLQAVVTEWESLTTGGEEGRERTQTDRQGGDTRREKARRGELGDDCWCACVTRASAAITSAYIFDTVIGNVRPYHVAESPCGMS